MTLISYPISPQQTCPITRGDVPRPPVTWPRGRGLLLPGAIPWSLENLLQRDLFSEMWSVRRVGSLLPFVKRRHSCKVSQEQAWGVGLAQGAGGTLFWRSPAECYDRNSMSLLS